MFRPHLPPDSAEGDTPSPSIGVTVIRARTSGDSDQDDTVVPAPSSPRDDDDDDDDPDNTLVQLRSLPMEDMLSRVEEKPAAAATDMLHFLPRSEVDTKPAVLSLPFSPIQARGNDDDLGVPSNPVTFPER